MPGNDTDASAAAFDRHAALRQQIREQQPTLGTFIRTPDASIVEVLGTVGLDFVALDTEHGPFGTEALDRCVLAARAVHVPALVRLPEASPSRILSVLDIGAAGIIVPHVHSAGQAIAAAAATRYASGTRGFSASHRAAGYGVMPPVQFRKRSDDSMIVIGQVEDRPGLENIDAIAAVAGLDAIFIGPADLAVSLGAETADDPAVVTTIDRICASCRRAGRTIGIFLHAADEVDRYRSQDISLFIIATDQLLLRAAARSMVDRFSAARVIP